MSLFPFLHSYDLFSTQEPEYVLKIKSRCCVPVPALRWLPITFGLKSKFLLFPHKASIGPASVHCLASAVTALPAYSAPASLSALCLCRTRARFYRKAFVLAVLSSWNVLPSHLHMALPHAFANFAQMLLLPEASQSTSPKELTSYPHSCPITVCSFILLLFIALNNTSDHICLCFFVMPTQPSPWELQLNFFRCHYLQHPRCIWDTAGG